LNEPKKSNLLIFKNRGNIDLKTIYRKKKKTHHFLSKDEKGIQIIVICIRTKNIDETMYGMEKTHLLYTMIML